MKVTTQSRALMAICAAAISALAFAANPVSAQCQYEVAAIIEGPPCPPLNFPTPLVGTGMNDLGHVTGWFYDCFQSAYDHGFFWTPKTGRAQRRGSQCSFPTCSSCSPTGASNASRCATSINQQHRPVEHQAILDAAMGAFRQFDRQLPAAR